MGIEKVVQAAAQGTRGLVGKIAPPAGGDPPAEPPMAPEGLPEPGFPGIPADTVDLPTWIGAYQPTLPEISESEKHQMISLTPGESSILGRMPGIPGRFRPNPGVSG